MNKEFSKSWKASKQPRKQRKYAAKAPLHIKGKLVSVNLSKDLRKKHSTRNLTLRKGDTVKVMRGKFKGKRGKVTKVMLKISRVLIEGVQVKKMDGSKSDVKMHPSKLQIMELNMDDKKRLKNLSKQAKVEEKK
jgi:large subunit ribosomal protein L24